MVALVDHTGAAVGALGVVARPVASILEVASKTGQSIVNRSSPKQWRATRIRLPRHLREDSPLLPYSWESAVGRAVLLETDGGCFRNEASSQLNIITDPPFFLFFVFLSGIQKDMARFIMHASSMFLLVCLLIFDKLLIV